MKTAVVALLCLAAPTLSKTVGSIQVRDYGEVWIIAPDWSAPAIEMLDNGFTMTGSSRVYFATGAYDGFEADMYWQVPLLNKHFSFNLDLSNVECQCNGAAYFTSMPAANPGDGGDYYCDANYVNGNWCPEYDIMEANMYTMASTMHTCKGEGGAWDSCDRWGCQVNAYNMDHDMMCPDDRCTINTNKPFSISFFQNSTEAYTQMQQEGRTTGFDLCHQPVLANMVQSFEGMVFSAMLWGGYGIDMGWLDGMTGCHAECDIDGSSITFTDFGLSDA